jgi:chemotaxis methyl-accepting protein methylase
VFEIKGSLLTEGVQTHEEMLHELYILLKKNGWFFVGETKDITNQYIKEEN